MLKTIFYSLAVVTHKMLLLPLKNKIHTQFALLCIYPLCIKNLTSGILFFFFFFFFWGGGGSGGFTAVSLKFEELAYQFFSKNKIKKVTDSCLF